MSIPPQWTIVGEAGKRLNATSRTFAELNAFNVVIDHPELAPGSVRFSILLASLAGSSELFPEEGQKVSVFRSGARFFQGRCTVCEQDDFKVDVTVEDVMWDMELEPFTQDQTDSASTSAERPSYAFASQSLTTSLNSVITRSAAKGIDVAVGSLAATFAAPEITLKQMTCAQAAAEIIRLTPDLMAWVDHSPTTPTFNTARRKSATVRTIAAGPNTSIRLKKETRFKVDHLAVVGVTRATNGGPIWTRQESGDAGTAQAGASSTITLRSGASTNSGSYVGATILIVSGTGSGQTRTISSYNGTTKVATVSTAWTTTPNNTSVYRIGGGLGTTGTRQVHPVAGEELDTYLPKNYFDSLDIQTTSNQTTLAEARDEKIRSALATPGGGSGIVTSGRGIVTSFTYYTGFSSNPSAVTRTFPAPVMKDDKGNVVTLTGGNNLVLIGTLPDWARDSLSAVEVTLEGTYLFYITGKDGQVQAPGWFLALMGGATTNAIKGWANASALPSGTTRDSIWWSTVNLAVKATVVTANHPTLTTIYRPQDYTYLNPPPGFASGMQESNGFDVYSGTISFRSALPGATRYRGCVVNVNGHRAEYASMLACVRGETLDLDSGTTTLTLGAPPRFASYRNFMDRIRSRGSNNVIYL